MVLMEFRYNKNFDLPLITSKNGMRIKTRNTLVERWPFKLKLNKVDPGFEEEFHALFASHNMGTETYLEWTSVD